jgi:hypothetical protein
MQASGRTISVYRLTEVRRLTLNEVTTEQQTRLA